MKFTTLISRTSPFPFLGAFGGMYDCSLFLIQIEHSVRNGKGPDYTLLYDSGVAGLSLTGVAGLCP